MRPLKKYLLTLLTLLCVLSGAAMPYLASQIQDSRIGKLRQKLALSTVDLTLRQESGAGPLLRLLSQEYTQIFWEEETYLSAQDALAAAERAVAEMDACDLLPLEAAERISIEKGAAEPYMLVAEDGSSALVWECTWEVTGCQCIVTVDDATGILMRLQVSHVPSNAVISSDSKTPAANKKAYQETYWEDFVEGAYVQMNRWSAFIQGYYGIALTDVAEVELQTDKASRYCRFLMICRSEDGAEEYGLTLDIWEDMFLFNYYL